MSDVLLCVVRGIINVNKFEVRLYSLPTYLLLIEDPTGLFSAPPPRSFRKEMGSIFIIFLCTFSKCVC